MNSAPRSCALGLVLALTAACGSTVAGNRVSSDTGIGAPSQSTATGGVVPGTTSAPGAGPGGMQLPTGSPGSGPDARVGATSGTTGVVPQIVNGPGVTDSTITFGATYEPDTGAANAAAGAGGTDPGDVRNYYNAVIDEVNRAGGVAGRRLVPAYYQVNSTDNFDTQIAAACEHWATDVKAFVMFDAGSDIARSCAERHGMLSLSTNGGSALTDSFREFPHHLEPTGIGVDRYAATTVQGLAQTDYYGQHPVIGVITWDNQTYRKAVSAGTDPALAQFGYRPQDTYYVPVPETLADLGSSSQAISSAILKFRQDGVTHVFIVDGAAGACGGTCLTLLFIKAASAQQYFPRYGMNDNNSPQAGLDAKLWKPSDVKGSRTVVWGNYDDKSDAGVAPNQARRECLAVMRRHGLDPSNVNAQVLMLQACDYIWFLRAVLGSAKIGVNRDEFVQLATGLGLLYRSPLTYRTAFSSTQHDGIAGFRRQALDDACGCYRYTSGVYS